MVKRKLIFLLFIETILYIYIFLKMFIFCVSFQLIATKQLIYSYPFNSDLYLAPFSDLVLVTKPLYDTTPWCVTHPTLPRSGFQERTQRERCFLRLCRVTTLSICDFPFFLLVDLIKWLSILLTTGAFAGFSLIIFDIYYVNFW